MKRSLQDVKKLLEEKWQAKLRGEEQLVKWEILAREQAGVFSSETHAVKPQDESAHFAHRRVKSFNY